MKQFDVVVSTGHGRLHLAQSVCAFATLGLKVRLICGWVPKRADGIIVRLVSKVVGRDISSGLRKRQIKLPNVDIKTCPISEFIDVGSSLLLRALRIEKALDWFRSFSWRVFGRLSRIYLPKDGRGMVFHCRSGAGRGGAILEAKKRGMKVVVDHSIAHPRYMDNALRPEYERNNIYFDFRADSVFWQQVLQDCKEADVIQVNSLFVRDTFIAEGFDPDKIKVVYLGQRPDFCGLKKYEDCDGGSCSERLVRLLFTGGFGLRKGAEYIFEACVLLKERKVPFVMDVVGDYSQSTDLISKFSKYDLPIEFHGPKPQEDLKLFLAAADVYIFPSLSEGCAQSGMEALAAGLCVIATKESGLPITDGETGFVVPAKNAAAIADRVEWINENRAIGQKVGCNAARMIVDNYTWEKYAEKVSSIYEQLLKGASL